MFDKSRLIKHSVMSISCDRIDGGDGTHFLPDEVSCNGSLVSVHTCFFYNDEGNIRIIIGSSYMYKSLKEWVNITHDKTSPTFI